MNRSRHIIFFSLLFTIAFVSGAAAQTLQSRFLPDRSYSVVIKQVLSGFDGFQEVVPVTNVQRIQMETGSQAGEAIPVTMTVHSSRQDDAAHAETEQWKFRFNAYSDGRISDLQTLSALEQLDEAVAFAILSRQLDLVLFQSVYTLQSAKGNTVIIESEAPRDGAEDFVDVTYSIDRSEAERRMRADDAPMVIEDKGTAVFHRGEQIFTERVLNEVNRIHVKMDDYGDAKDVIMNKDLRITVTVTPR